MRSIRNVSTAVIGSCGFLGSHMVDFLLRERGCQVLALDNLLVGRREFLNDKATFKWFDITRNEQGLADLFAEHKVEYVFNYASLPFVPSGFGNPILTFDVTAAAVANVLVACERANVEGLLQVSSAEIYKSSKTKITEDSPIEPHSTYGVSKLAADGLVQARYREVGTRAIAMRQFNCYGPRPTWPYVIPTIISQLSEGNTVKLGNNSKRDFQFATDAVMMAVELLEYGQWGQVYNMGSDESVHIYDLAQTIGKLMNHDKVNIELDPTRIRGHRVEIWELRSDSTKLFSTIPSRPKVGLVEGLEKTISYFEDLRLSGSENYASL